MSAKHISGMKWTEIERSYYDAVVPESWPWDFVIGAAGGLNQNTSLERRFRPSASEAQDEPAAEGELGKQSKTHKV